MNKAWRFNALFEEELAGIYNHSGRSRNILYHLEHIFHLLAGPQDTVITSRPLPPELAKEWDACGFTPAPSNEIAGRELVEWGATSVIRNGKTEYDTGRLELSRRLNSKIVQARWKLKEGIPSARLAVCSSPDDLNAFIHSHSYPVIIKPPYTTAGRGFRILVSPATPVGSLPKEFITERWLNRKGDYSLLLDINRGRADIIAACRMIITPRGGFTGIMLDENLLQEELPSLDTFPAISDYTGPASVDWFTANEEIKHVSEINFRYTMGRILLELSRKTALPGRHALIFTAKKPENAAFSMPLTPENSPDGSKYPKRGYYLVYNQEKYLAAELKMAKVNDF